MDRFACIALFLLAVGLIPASAQELEPVVGDRPDFTESALTIDRGHVQLEAGWTHERADDADETSLGEILVRVGLAPRWELRFGVGSFVRIEEGDESATGWEDPSLEAKVRLFHPERGPIWSLLFGSALPAGAEAISANEAQPFAKLLVEADLSERFEIGANLGYTRGAEDDDTFDQVSASLALGAALSERWGAFVELFGFTREEPGGDESSYVNGGLTWLAANALQLDARVGTGLAGNDVDLFGGVGLVKRW